MMKWKLDGDDVVFYLEKKSKGFLSIGLGENMYGANIFQISKTNGGLNLKLEDCYVNGHKPPTCSGAQNLILEHQEASPDSLKIQFRRPKKTGDPEKNFII